MLGSVNVKSWSGRLAISFIKNLIFLAVRASHLLKIRLLRPFARESLLMVIAAFFTSLLVIAIRSMSIPTAVPCPNPRDNKAKNSNNIFFIAFLYLVTLAADFFTQFGVAASGTVNQFANHFLPIDRFKYLFSMSCA